MILRFGVAATSRAIRRAVALCACGWAAAAAQEPAEPAARRVPFRGWTEPVQNLQLMDLQGRDIGARLQPRAEGNTVSLALPEGEQFVAKPKTIATLTLRDSQKLTLPGGLVQPLARGVGPDMVWFRLALSASPMPAVWNDGAKTYTTQLTVGLVRPPQAPDDLEPQRPVLIKLAFDGLAADEPPPLSIERAGLEHEKSVELHFVPTSETPRLLVRSTLSDVNLELRALPRLELRPQRRELLGFGLGRVDVAVERVAPHGAALPAERAIPVLLELDPAAVPSPSAPSIPSGTSTAVFSLRSVGLGPVEVQATAAGATASASIRQTFPTGPLIAVITGGALGGFARRFVKGAPRHATARRITEGIIVALIAFVAGILGIYLGVPATLLGTEAGAFLTASLAGFAGVTLLEQISGKRAAAGGQRPAPAR